MVLAIVKGTKYVLPNNSSTGHRIDDGLLLGTVLGLKEGSSDACVRRPRVATVNRNIRSFVVAFVMVRKSV